MAEKVLNIVHFNDVYNPVSDKRKGGGAAKFASVLGMVHRELGGDEMDTYQDVLVFFSGDFLSPSNMSTVTQGKHMIPVMNLLNVDCAALGNHDQDYGNAHCEECVKELMFPVLCSNIKLDDGLGTILGGCLEWTIVSQNGVKVGLLSVSEDWTELLPIKEDCGYTFEDEYECIKRVIQEQKASDNVDAIVLLTHSRLPNDLILCQKLAKDPDNIVDLVLGGHDHCTHCSLVNDQVLLVKSGTDFFHMTWITMTLRMKSDEISDFSAVSSLDDSTVDSKLRELFVESNDWRGKRYDFRTRLIKVDNTVEDHPLVAETVESLTGEYQRKLLEPIGVLHGPLDARFSTLRLEESNAGNLIADVFRRAYKVDCVLLGGGDIRADRIVPAGPVTMKDVLDLVPFPDPIVSRRVTGDQLWNALEHAVSGVPKMDGKFPQVSGLRVVYDPLKPVGSRLQKVFVTKYHEFEEEDEGYDDGSGLVHSESEFEPLDRTEEYTLAITGYVSNGGNGFECFKELTDESCVLRDEETGYAMSFMLRNFFWGVELVNKLRLLVEQHRIEMTQSRPMDDAMDGDVTVEATKVDAKSTKGTGSRKSAEEVTEEEKEETIQVERTVSSIQREELNIEKEMKKFNVIPPLKSRQRSTLFLADACLEDIEVGGGYQPSLKMAVLGEDVDTEESIKKGESKGKEKEEEVLTESEAASILDKVLVTTLSSSAKTTTEGDASAVSAAAVSVSSTDDDPLPAAEQAKKMTRFKSSDSFDDEKAEDGSNTVSLLTVAPPQTEHRVMTTEQFEQFNLEFGSKSMRSIQYFKRLPSFLDFDHLPSRQESLLDILETRGSLPVEET